MVRWRRRRGEGVGSTDGGLQSPVIRRRGRSPVNTSGDKPRERVLFNASWTGLAWLGWRGQAGLERVELEHGKG